MEHTYDMDLIIRDAANEVMSVMNEEHLAAIELGVSSFDYIRERRYIQVIPVMQVERELRRVVERMYGEPGVGMIRGLLNHPGTRPDLIGRVDDEIARKVFNLNARRQATAAYNTPRLP